VTLFVKGAEAVVRTIAAM